MGTNSSLNFLKEYCYETINNKCINLAPIPAGTYFITSFQNGITKTMKIVKE